MNILTRYAVVLLATALPAVGAFGQVISSGTHTLTVQVLPVTDISINAGGITLDMASAVITAGANIMTISDQTSVFRWATNSSGQKVTVRTSLASPIFTLRLVAVSPTTGTAAPEFDLTTISHDLLTGLGRSSGTASLRYTGVALATQGTGADNHVVTYTIQAE